MKPHPRPPIIRKTIKWGGAAVTALLVVAWIGSGWWQVGWNNPRGDFAEISAGHIHIGQQRPFTSSISYDRWFANGVAFTFAFQWRPYWDRSKPSWYVIVPLWIPAAVALATTAVAWRLDTLARRRARLNLCSNCNYDRTGLASGAVCPECGAAPASRPA